MKRDLGLVALEAIDEILEQNAKKHPGNEWRGKPATHHLFKGARHALTAALIENGDSPPDGEDHAKLAITRLAMALARGELPE